MDQRLKRNTAPHVGVIRVSVFVHRMSSDGSIDPDPIDCSDLFKDHAMAKKAEMHVKGFDKWDCVKKVKDTLDRMNDNGKMGE
jgi:hypothetical protein